MRALFIDPVAKTTSIVAAPATQRAMQDMLSQHEVIARIDGFRFPEKPAVIYSLVDEFEEYTSGAFEIAGKEIRGAAVCLQFDTETGETLDLDLDLLDVIKAKIAFSEQTVTRAFMTHGLAMVFATGSKVPDDVASFGEPQVQLPSITLRPVVVPERFPDRIVHRGRGRSALVEHSDSEIGAFLEAWAATRDGLSRLGAASARTGIVSPQSMLLACCSNSGIQPKSLLDTDLIRPVTLADATIIFAGISEADVLNYVDREERHANLTSYIDEMPSFTEPNGQKGEWKQIKEREILPLVLQGLKNIPEDARILFGTGQGWFVLAHQGYVRAAIHLPDDLSHEFDDWPDHGDLYLVSSIDDTSTYKASLISLFVTQGFDRELAENLVDEMIEREH